MSSDSQENIEDYDIFVSYDDLTGEEYAERIYNTLKRRGYKVFVAHLEKIERSGKFEKYIDRVIAKSHTFILINTLDAPNRPQIIREFKRAFSVSKLNEENFWVFRHDQKNVPYTTQLFNSETNYDLSKENQTPFKSTTNLSHAVLSKCDKKRLRQSPINELVSQKNVKLDENQRKDYSELLQVKNFAHEFEKRGYEIDFEREIGNHLSADLILKLENNWIICEFKEHAEKIKSNIFSYLLKYKNEIETIDNTIDTELWLIGRGEFSNSIRDEARKYNIRLIDDSNINEVFEKGSIYLSVPKSVIIFGESMKIRFRVDHIENKPILLKIKNQKGKMLLMKRFEVKSTKWMEYTITAEGGDWKEPEALFTIMVEYGNKSALATIWRSNFGASIELDQKVYTWTDKVYITLIAPDFINNEAQYVDISTNEGKLAHYKLVQTSNDSGIFVGEISLSGLKKYLTKNKRFLHDFIGITKGKGPNDGLLSCGRNDAIQISFRLTDSDTVLANALIRWNIAEISWLEASYPDHGIGVIRVIDPDMNLNSNAIDKLEVKVWSDSDAMGKSLILSETNENTGIFEGQINFDTEKSDETTLRVSEGDTIVAEYTDFTLPDPYSEKDVLDISGTAFIGTLCPPLERISAKNLRFLDDKRNEITKLSVGKTVFVTAVLENKHERDQQYAFLAQISEEGNVNILLGSESGVVKAGKSENPLIKWTPEFGGRFTVSVFVWESVDNPTALSPVLEKKIAVEGKTLEEMGIQKPMFREPIEPELRKKIGIPKKEENIVSIPNGTSVPGCEKTGKCFIPTILHIRVNEEVKWINEDSVFHTITSGIVGNGPDGEFDSSVFGPSNSFSHKFTKKGEYPYFDMMHPWQTGIVIVE